MTDAMVAALITAVVGGLLGYGLGNRRLRYERLYQLRAEVISELSAALYMLQRSITTYVNPIQSMGVDRNQQRMELSQAFDELMISYNSNATWLEPDTCNKIEVFLEMSYTNVGAYVDDLGERGYPRSREGRDASSRLLGEMQPLRRSLEAEFRAIVYPRPWYHAPINLLEVFQSRNRKPAGKSQGD